MNQQTRSPTHEEIFADFKWRNPHLANDSRNFIPIDSDTILVRLCCGAEVAYNYKTKNSIFRCRNGGSYY